MADLAQAGQSRDDFNRKYARTRHNPLDFALRHEEQAVAGKPHHFRFQLRPVGKRNGTGAAYCKFQTDRFHDQAGHPRNPARNQHRFCDGKQFAAVLQIGFPAQAMGLG